MLNVAHKRLFTSLSILVVDLYSRDGYKELISLHTNVTKKRYIQAFLINYIGKIMLTIEQRRKTDRMRRERWRKRKLEQGCKQIQLMLSPEAQAVLMEEKSRTGEPYVRIIHRAIIQLGKAIPVVSSEIKAEPVVLEASETQNSDPGKTKPFSKIRDKKKESQQGQLKLF